MVRNSAENFAQVNLELGGKSPVIVFEDANIESATNGVVSGIFAASGQSCVAGSRLYLQDTIADKFVEALVERAGKIRIGDPLAKDTQMGPLATQAQLTRIDAEVKKAQESGAKVLHGGRPPPHLNTGWFYEPTIVECPDQSLSIVDTELFGPVLSVLRFSSEDEAISRANATKYGLACGIFSRDMGHALHR